MKPTIDLMMRNRDIGEIIAVFVDGSNKFHGSEYLSSETIGDYETYITQDLVNHIDANYRTIAHRSSRGITGYSMGGYGSMRLALKYPSVFSVVVAQAGFYDNDTDWFKKNWAEPTAFANPKDWVAFNQMFWMTQGAFACAAGMSPNPAKPPFFFDKPYELVDGKAQLMPEVWERWVKADVIHGHLDGYLKQPIRLRGIMIVHGRGDGIVSVSQAQALDKAMTELGIEHVYDEHGGGHDFIAEKSLQFMSEHLAFELPPTMRVQPRGKPRFSGSRYAGLATMWGELKRGR
jgi:predicted esterase